MRPRSRAKYRGFPHGRGDRRRISLRALMLCALLWAAGGMLARAQWQNGGSMTGQVLDASGAPVPHARLDIEETGTGTTYALYTDGQGRFLLPQVAPGDYTIEAQAAGFAPWSESGVEVDAGAQVKVSPKLGLAVQAKAPAAQESQPVGATARQRVSRSASQRASEPAGSQLTVQGSAVRRDEGKAAAVDVPAPEKVHARVTIATAHGTVTAEIAEVPIQVTQTAGWAAFDPGTGRPGGRASGANQAVSETATNSTKSSVFAARASSRIVPAPVKATAAQGGDLPSIGALYEPTGTQTLQAAVAATRARVQKKQAKLQELAEAFVPSSQYVTNTDAYSKTANENVSSGEDSTSALQADIQQFEPTEDETAESGELAGQQQDVPVDLDVMAPKQHSATSRLHGKVFVEDRDKAWGSRNAFTTLTTQTSDGSFVTAPYDPPDRRMQYGLEMGGGVANGRGQWFVAVDELTRNFPGMAVPSDPEKFFASLTGSQLQTLAARLGAGPAVVSPVDQAQQDYTQAMGNLTALLGPVARTTRQTIAFPRFDWKLDDRNRIQIGYDMVRLDAKNGMRSAPTETWGIGSFGTRALRLDAISASLHTFLTPNLLNDLRYTHAHDLESEMADAPTPFEEQFAKNYFGVPPEVSVASGSGGFKFGTPSSLNRPAYPDELRQEAADTLSWVHGRNQIDVGYALDYVRDHTIGLPYATGVYRYATKEAFVADMLSPDHCDASSTGAGSLPCWSTFRQTTGPNDFRFDTADYAGFATDTLKVLPSLTVSIGARYDYEKLPKPNAALVNPDIPQTAVLPSEGNLSPRAGFAWELPWSRGRMGRTTVLRAGFGIFYDRIPNTSVLAALTQTGAPGAQRIYLFKPLDVGAPKFPYIFGPHPDVQVAPDATYFATGFQHSRAEQAQLSLEQSLGRHLQLTLNYWGSFGSHLPRIVDQNIDLTHVGRITYTIDDPKHLGPLPVTYISKFYYRRLNPKYQQMAAMESNANARYQAFGFSLVGRLPHAMALTLGYRYAHAVDDNPYAQAYRGRWNVLDPADLALEHGTSNDDIRDRLTGGLVLHEPWRAEGWLSEVLDGYTMAMTGSMHSGRPYTMRLSSTVPSMSCSYQEWLEAGSNCVLMPRQGVITGVPVPISGLGSGIDGAGGGKWLPQIGRNTFRYPGTFGANLRMGKKFALRGRTSLLFQADIGNVLNHRNATDIETMGYSLAGVKTSTGVGKLTYLSGDEGRAQFGTVLNTNDTRVYTDRQVELIMKLIF